LPYAIVFIYSFLNQFYVPAEAATLPGIVSESFLPQANSIFFITQQSSLVIGFGLAGILETVFGFRSTVLGMAMLLFVAFVSTSFLPNKKPVAKLAKNLEDRVSGFFDEIVEGYRFIKDTHKILLPFVLLLGLQVIIAVIVTNLPKIGADILGVSPNASGIFIMLPAGIGAVIGTFIISKILTNKFKKGSLIFICMLGFTAVLSLATLVLPFIDVYLLRIAAGAILFVVLGFSVVGVLIPSITYLQEETPEKLLGRVFGNFWFLTTIVTVLPVLFSATIADLLGIRALLLLVGIISLVPVLIFRKAALKL
jgi:MFS family permease